MNLKSLRIAVTLAIAGVYCDIYASSQELPDGFDAKAYIGRYKDLSTAFNAQTELDINTFAKKHFLSNGREEHREARSYASLGLPTDFKEDSYLSLNPDLAEHAKLHRLDVTLFAINHFLHTGSKEKRSYVIAPDISTSSLPSDFNPETYLSLNEDVRAYAIKNGLSPLEFSQNHYLNNGRNEDRKYRQENNTHKMSLFSSSIKEVTKENSERPKTPSEILRAQKKGTSPTAERSFSPSQTMSPQKPIVAAPLQKVTPPEVTKKTSTNSSIGGVIQDTPMTFEAATTKDEFSKRKATVDLKVTQAIGHRKTSLLPSYKKEIQGLLRTPFLSPMDKASLDELLGLIDETLSIKK